MRNGGRELAPEANRPLPKLTEQSRAILSHARSGLIGCLASGLEGPWTSAVPEPAPAFCQAFAWHSLRCKRPVKLLADKQRGTYEGNTQADLAHRRDTRCWLTATKPRMCLRGYRAWPSASTRCSSTWIRGLRMTNSINGSVPISGTAFASRWCMGDTRRPWRRSCACSSSSTSTSGVIKKRKSRWIRT